MTIRTKAILSLSGVFLLGAVSGALVFGVFIRGEIHQQQRLRSPEGFREFFNDRLHLTPAQRDSLGDEIENAYYDLSRLRRATAEEYQLVLDSLKRRLDPLLTPEQRQLLENQEMRFRRMLPHEHDLPDRHLGPTLPPRPVPSGVDSVLHDSRPHLQGGTAFEDLEPAPPATPRHSDSGAARQLSPQAPTDPGDLLPAAQHLAARLKLSAEQTAKVDAIIRETRGHIHLNREKLRDFPELRFEAVRRELRQMDERIYDILTPAQRPEYEVVRQEVRQRMHEHMMHRRNGQRVPGDTLR